MLLSMKRAVSITMLFAVMIGPVLLPDAVSARAISVSQTITITARVAAARSIIVNEQGRMTSVISNTSEAITPKVYRSAMHGPQQPLTPELLAQYQSVIADRNDLEGIEIPVEPPRATNESVQRLLFGSISTFLFKI
jgi:hypothetical protein